VASRYYISRVIGDGTVDNPYTSELRNYIAENWPDEPHFSQQVIHPNVLLWCIMKYDLSDAAHADVVANVPQVFDFPATGLNRTMAEIPAAKRTLMQTKLESVGFDFSWATGSTTVRQILQRIVWSIELASWAEVSISAISHFDLDTTVANIPVVARNKTRTHMEDLSIPVDWIMAATTVREIVQKILHNDDSTKRLFGVGTQRQWFYNDEDEF